MFVGGVFWFPCHLIRVFPFCVSIGAIIVATNITSDLQVLYLPVGVVSFPCSDDPPSLSLFHCLALIFSLNVPGCSLYLLCSFLNL